MKPDLDARTLEAMRKLATLAYYTAEQNEWRDTLLGLRRAVLAQDEEVARLREAARKVLECADKGIGVAKLSADDLHWMCPRCNAKVKCKPGCALNALLGALDELAALAPAARKESDRG